MKLCFGGCQAYFANILIVELANMNVLCFHFFHPISYASSEY